MRKILFSIAILCSSVVVNAQTVGTFETPLLPGSDTFYVNQFGSGNDVGFNSGLAHFPHVYDSVYNSWYGFSYSNKRDTTTSGYLNDHAAITYTGYNGSAQYAAVFCSNPNNYSVYETNVTLTGAASGKSVNGFYITNSTYAYLSMRDGDGSFAKKFGGTTGTDPDWFRLTVKGFLGGVQKPDTVDFYLADFRPAGTANDSIIKGWHWVNLLPIGHVDSLSFTLNSTDTNAYGMKTPAYFCIDNFTTNETSLGVSTAVQPVAKLYPIPVTDVLNVELTDNTITHFSISDIMGKEVFAADGTERRYQISTTSFAPGVYQATFYSGKAVYTARFQK